MRELISCVAHFPPGSADHFKFQCGASVGHFQFQAPRRPTNERTKATPTENRDQKETTRDDDALIRQPIGRSSPPRFRRACLVGPRRHGARHLRVQRSVRVRPRQQHLLCRGRGVLREGDEDPLSPVDRCMDPLPGFLGRSHREWTPRRVG